LQKQETKGLFTFSIVVTDNDKEESGREVVCEFAAESPIAIAYCVQPVQNIALARNKALENAGGEFIAFIDDDEFPEEEWLRNLLETCKAYGADGVLGPVMPYFQEKPPNWVERGGIFERPLHNTGYRIAISDARTGNVMFRNRILEGTEQAFNAEFRTGGEDVDFFRRMMNKGRVFVWCNEAVVHEIVPPYRCKRSYLLKRGLLRGRNSFRQKAHRIRKVVKSLIAIPAYGVALPFLFLTGQAYFMRYFVKLCDHLGVFMALLGINLIRERD
jgi:glycosyltransferase involved in cell wall biosynthesis